MVTLQAKVFFGRWNPATIKGTIVNGQRVPYPAGTNFSNAPRATAPAAPAAAPAASATPTGGLLRRGNRGEEVKQLQRDLGMTGDEIDGIFGPATERAVRAFQQNSGAKVDGIVGPETRAQIAKYQEPEDNSAPAQTPDAAPEPIDGGIAPGTTAGGPSQLRQRQQGQVDTAPEVGTAPEVDTTAPEVGTAPEVDTTAPEVGTTTAAPEVDTTAPQRPVAPEGEPETIEVTTQDQANSIFQNPDSTDAERQAAREFYGATPDPVEFPDIGAAMIGRAEVQPGDNVVIDGEEATVVTNDNEEKYFVGTDGQPIGELPQPDAQTTVDSPSGDTSGGDSGVNNNATTDPEVNQTPPGALAQPDADDDTPKYN